ncbi:dynamin family protein [Gemmata sp. JC673]|uniref:Dynamin family protein n=1 Tax=Gemmata algarum TaxID=2975278 RepID=A0ABU5FDC3_9BACT|nr:dynamin family protein [Gemmata algarum]MDY3563789.1 dynamin family protein [Gemmata algarum]
MRDVQERLCYLLRGTAEGMRQSGAPGEAALQMERLAGQVEQPCEVAVVGRVKAGKSTFINALLGAEDELAKVGATETTATINYFRYGIPDPARPVRCYWRSGQTEDVSRDFLDRLQGNDLETLRRAEGIHHLEYRLPNRFLEQAVLVDTPGLGAVVDTHQDRTAEYMNLYNQLRHRHDLETQELDSRADAVIYLTDAVARVTDRDFLDDFGQVTRGRSRARNAIGVLARIDQQPEILSRRHDLAAKIARQLEQSLNTVLPVSGGLQFALNRLLAREKAGLNRLVAAFSRVPAETAEALLASEELYLVKRCLLSAEEREQLLDDKIPWTVFTTIVRRVVAARLSTERLEEELTELAGFRPLRDALDRHFFQRAAYLRCFRIVNDARAVLDNIRFRELPKARSREREDQTRRDRFLAFIRGTGKGGAVAQELEEFVNRTHEASRRSERLESDLRRWSGEFDRLFHDLEEHNADFEVLQLLEQQSELFTGAELDELRPLFGLYGLENEKRLPSGQRTLSEIARFQQRWHRVALEQRNNLRTQIAERAVVRLGLIVEAIHAPR